MSINEISNKFRINPQQQIGGLDSGTSSISGASSASSANDTGSIFSDFGSSSSSIQAGDSIFSGDAAGGSGSSMSQQSDGGQIDISQGIQKKFYC